MTLSGGDVLARGGKSAQFGGASSITDFENDFIYLGPEELCNKYGLSEAEYDTYAAQRLEGTPLPDLKSTTAEGFGAVVEVVDKRHDYLGGLNETKAVVEVKGKFEPHTYEEFHPILDRILVMRVADDPNMELLEDGSMRDKRTSFIIPAKYRQHSNVGIVLALGQFVVMGGVRIPLSELLRVGDKITFGDYNSEILQMEPSKAEAICDSIGVNYTHDEQGLRIVRVQDVRGVERAKASESLGLMEPGEPLV